MTKRILAPLLTAVCLCFSGLTGTSAQSGSPGGPARSLAERLGYKPADKLLIINIDDVAGSHAANAAAIDALENGLATSATIMVPCPWFPEIAAYAKEHPEKLRAIIAGRRAAVEAIYADPDAAAAVLQKMWNFDPAVARQAVRNMIGPKMWSLGDFNRAELDRTVDGLRLIGEVKGEIDWNKLIDQSFLPADLQRKL